MSPSLLTPRRSRRLRVVIALVVAAGLAALLARRRDELDAFGSTFAHVEWAWLAAAGALNLLSVAAGSLAWWTVINEGMAPPRPGYRPVFSAYSVGLLANAILPGRAGELARIAVLARHTRSRDGLWATLAGTVLAFRLLDLVPSLLLAGFVLFAVPLPHWALSGLAVIAIVGVSLLVLAFSAARRHELPMLEEASRVRRIVTMGRQGLGVFHAPLSAATAALHQCLAWSAQLLAVWATLRAFNIDLPLSGAALVLVLINVAILFPLWPGNVGLLQIAVVVPLGRYGVSAGDGIAFGIGLQALETTVGVSLGLVFLAREGLSVAALRHIPETAGADY